MDVKTGEIKALVNVCRASDSIREFGNASFFDVPLEPGTIFTPISVMAATEETGLLLTDSIDTGKDRSEFGQMFNVLDPHQNFRINPECVEI